MKTKFAMSATTVNVVRINNEHFLDKLPPKVYNVEYSNMGGFYLSIVKDKLTIPDKIYGDVETRVNKCITTFQQRKNTTGILLTGDKGTGKSLCMSVLANTVIDVLNIPIILVKTPYAGSAFEDFIVSIGECCLIFDEFAKMYPSYGEGSSQSDLLSLFDGIDKTKRMIILTENDKNEINQFMINRPGRIYYHFEYTKIDENSVLEYCKDKNIDKKTANDINDLRCRSSIFSFDMLQTIVEEYLRFNEPVEEILKDLNIYVKSGMMEEMQIEEIIELRSNEKRKVYGTRILTNPLSLDNNTNNILVKVEYNDAEKQSLIVDEDWNEDEPYFHLWLNANNLVYETGKTLFFERDGFRIVATDLPSYRRKFNRYNNIEEGFGHD